MLILHKAQRKKLTIKGGNIMNKNDGKDIRKNAPKGSNPGQPEPLSGSHKVKNRNHSKKKKKSSHDM